MAYNRGYIYCLSNESFKDDIFKIGFTTRNPFIRMKELYNTSTPTEFKMVLCKEVNECSKTESIIHYLLKKYRINKSREFFKIDIEKVKNIFDMLDGEYIDDLKKITTDDDFDEMEELEDLNKVKVWREQKQDGNEESESEEEESDEEDINLNFKKGNKYKIYKCDMCERIFSKKSVLVNHLNRKNKCVNPKIKIVSSSDIIY